jgi:hypothetical protein
MLINKNVLRTAMYVAAMIASKIAYAIVEQKFEKLLDTATVD